MSEDQHDDTMTESTLVDRAKSAISSCNWVVGECASEWTVKFAKGRTDADFANLVGLTADQVYQRRRVWERFGDASQEYPECRWSHFYVALNWDNAEDCLRWANDFTATIAEMKAWRRAALGEELTEPGEEDIPEHAIQLMDMPLVEAKAPTQVETAPWETPGEQPVNSNMETQTVTGVGQRTEGDAGYAPFSAEARQPMVATEEKPASKPAPTPEERLAKMQATMERMEQVLSRMTDEQWDSIPTSSLADLDYAHEQLGKVIRLQMESR